MATRDILNYNGDIIGQLTLPDYVTEEEWANALAAYAKAPASVKDLIINKRKYYQGIAIMIIDDLMSDNVLNGITTAQSDQMFDDYADVLARLREGALPTAIYRLQTKIPSGFVTQELQDTWLNKLKGYL